MAQGPARRTQTNSTPGHPRRAGHRPAMRTALLALGGLLGGLPAGCGDAPASGRAMSADAGGRAAMLSGAPPVELPTREPEPAGEDDRRAAEIAAALARDQALIASGLGRGDRAAPKPATGPATAPAAAPAAAAPPTTATTAATPAARPEPAVALPEPRWNQTATRPAERPAAAPLGFDIEPPSLVPTADRRRPTADRPEPRAAGTPGTPGSTAPRDAALDAIAAIAAAASDPETDEATSADWLESVRPGRGTRPDAADAADAATPPARSADRPAATDPVAGGVVLPTTERALPPNPVSVARSDLLLALLVDGIDHPSHALPNAITSALSTVGDAEATIDASLFRNVPETERDLVNAFAAFAKALTPTLAPATATAADDDDDAAAGPVDREAMLEAIDRLRAAVARTPQLAIRRAALCRQVDGFGVFDGLEQPHRFLAGSPNAFIVYLELDEFHSERREGGAWVTELEQRVQIYNDRDARAVWATDWSEVVDVNANRRRDFFTAQVIELPPAFSLGVFHLKVQVRDRLTGAESETSIEFEMVAGGPGLTRR